ncbi:helix-turn-helix domain-containing protein [Serratia fonticola]|uniref:helix-turn-helix domain-containing protein n=1 Tax=Serratia fonticola TaxID=47917 RepID=UPI001377E166|nr:helix-turn-helix domain-containing protein [Serratia fonticola]NCG55224.1 helix-turn-helix domain-containing protein [Serratia fonticola]
MGIQERLRQVMDLKGLTIKELAERSGMPYRSLQNYLRGEREPNNDALLVLRTHLGISVDWLLTGEGDMYLSEAESAPSLPVDTPFSNSDLTMLELLNQLDPEVRKDLMRSAEEKQRMIELERKVSELSAELEKNKRAS